MAPRDASQVQLDFPQLTADLIRELRLTGTLGLLNLSDTVIPVISVGDVRPPTFSFSPVTFESSEITFGQQWGAPGSTVIADTGALAAGTYDLQLQLAYGGRTSALSTPLRIEHRNAANNATLATLLSLFFCTTDLAAAVQTPQFGYVIGANERLRIITGSILFVCGQSGSIYAAIRPTP